MKLLYSLKDNEFEDNGYNHTRTIVRAVIYNDDKEVALIHLYGDDIFGHRDYYETPGGGVKENESLLDALKREILEEVGAKIDHIEEIGEVIDYYNLIKRRNDQYYYLAHAYEITTNHLEDYEKTIFENIKWVNITEAIKLYEETKRTKISSLVINRELPILKLAKEKLDII